MLLRDGPGLTDQQLLEDYISRRDQAALAALVQRHGPMVWGVCRRVLTNYHDAEDAFQATFLVLVRRAASIASPALLANWLYGVAHQTAIKARATVAKRKMRERQVTEMPEPAGVEQNLWNDLQPLLDQELSRLPEKYRGVIVLCDLEGKTRKEVAAQLGWAEGTVASRLARARIMLAKRLTRRGVALSGGALAAVIPQQAASAGVPYSVVDSTIKAASLLAAGKPAATGAISVKVAALTEGVLKAMLFSKLKAAPAIVLILGFVATGATILTCRTAAGQDDKKPAAEKPVEPRSVRIENVPGTQRNRVALSFQDAAAAKQQKEKEGFTAWGKEVGGLQAGLSLRPDRRAYHHGERVRFVVRIRNVGKEPVKFEYVKHFLYENPPTVTDSAGKKVSQLAYPLAILSRRHAPVEETLAPGKEIALESPFDGAPGTQYELLPSGGKASWDESLPLYGVGKVSIQYERVLGNSSKGKIKLDPALSKLATGKLELEINSNPPPAELKKEGKKPDLPQGLEFLAPIPEFHEFRFGQDEVTIRDLAKRHELVVHGPSPAGPNGGFMVSRKDGETLALSMRDGKCCGIQRLGRSGMLESEPPPATEKKQKQEECFTAWGKEVGGLQAGLSLRPGEKRAYRHGESLTLVVRVRNVGKETVKFEYIRQFLDQNPPTVTKDDGKTLPQVRFDMLGEHAPTEVTLKPGKVIELESGLTLQYGLGPEIGTGKVSFQYERVFGNSSAGFIKIDPSLMKLATGKLEVEINEAAKK
jgi:RNA polymerase sigma factor (sigma-70 family)